MIWILYNILFAIGFTILLPKFLWRIHRRGGYKSDFMQRFGVYRPDVKERLQNSNAVWVHAVSVGEIFVALQLMTSLRERCPSVRTILSTTTSTGYAIGKEKIRDPDMLIYFPLDFPPVTRRVLDVIRPKALILIEAEFWPNLLRIAAMRDVPVFLINGRLSDSSFQGYRKLAAFSRRIFPLFRALCVQSEADRDRFMQLGAPSKLLHVLNSAKYESSGPDSHMVRQARAALHEAGFGEDRIILLGGSTWPGEEEILLQIYRELRQFHKDLALVLAPRHVERTPEVLAEIRQQGLTVQRRSTIDDLQDGADVFLLDTTGELASFYACASIIFVGKSLTAKGGQNVIEPAVCQRAIVVGPNMQNFPVVLEDFKQAHALYQVQDRVELGDVIARLLEDETERRELGERAGELVRSKAGGIAASVDLVVEALPT